MAPALSIPGNIGVTLANGDATNPIFGETSKSFLSYINTVNTARDMMEIVKAYGMDKLNYYGAS